MGGAFPLREDDDGVTLRRLARASDDATQRQRCDITPKMVQKSRKRSSVEDTPVGPKERRSTVLSQDVEATIIAFR